MPSLSAWGLPTPVVALACICDVDIQVFSGAGVSILPPLKGVTPHGVGKCPQGRGDRSVRGGPAKLVEGFTHKVCFLVQPHRNRPAEFARSSLSAWACQRRLLPLPVSVMLIFRCFLVQVGDFILYGVCKLTFVRRWRGSGEIFCLMKKTYEITPQSVLRTASSPFRGAYSYRFSTGTSFGCLK